MDALAKNDILQILVFAAMFVIVGMIMRLSPVAAFGAMAFTVGKYGLGSLMSLGQLMLCMYLTCVAFVFTVLGTSSSESVVPQLMRKLEHIRVSKSVVGLVVPSGVTFNPDGQCIYYTMAVARWVGALDRDRVQLVLDQDAATHVRRGDCRCTTRAVHRTTSA